MKENKKIVLENGKVILGYGFGDLTQNPVGELVFTTAMTGYQETLTDPSYKNQIINFSYPLQGNYGINVYDNESSKVHATAMIINDLCKYYDHHLANKSLDEYLKEEEVLGIHGVDTRYITKLLRDGGSLKCKIVDIDVDENQVVKELKQIEFTNHIAEVATPQSYHIPGSGYRVVLLDFGYKRNILKELVKRNAEVYVLPYHTTLEEIKRINPDGILISNGPGNPEEYISSIKLIKQLIGKYKIFGICLGHQLYGLASGGKTFKMKYGHRGINHPVRNKLTGKVYITSQNHGYCVNIDTIENKNVKSLYVAVNDLTSEGLININTGDFTVQFHPESHPGPSDTSFLFDDFLELIGGNNNAK